MPNTQAAAKALRQSKKRAAHNRRIKTGVDFALRRARRAIAANSQEATKLANTAVKLLDKAAQKGVMKSNTAARLKSRLLKSLHKIKK